MYGALNSVVQLMNEWNLKDALHIHYIWKLQTSAISCLNLYHKANNSDFFDELYFLMNYIKINFQNYLSIHTF